MPRISSKTQIKNLKLSLREMLCECDKTIRLIRRLESRAAAVDRSAAKRSTLRKTGPVAVKYRDKRGNTWSGRGRPARWIVEAEKTGKKRESFLVRNRKNR